MITEKEVMSKLYELPGMFEHYIKNKQWTSAKACYDRALVICTFLEVEDAVKMEFFGNRAYVEEGEEVKDSLFQEKSVLKMLSEYCTAEEKEIRLIRIRMELNRRQKKSRL